VQNCGSIRSRGRQKHRYDDNIKTDLRETVLEGVNRLVGDVLWPRR
jgi:hypothetical protein